MRKNRVIAAVIFLFSCSVSRQHNAVPVAYDERGERDSSYQLLKGVPAFDQPKIVYNRSGKAILEVRLSDPVIVDSADKEYGWGFFQFPSIGKAANGDLIAKWNMQHDAVEGYGLGGESIFTSADGGKTWIRNTKPEFSKIGLKLPNGDVLAIHTPKAIPVKELQLPAPIDPGKEILGRKFGLYKLKELPESLQGVYFDRLPKGQTKWVREHAKLIDTNAVRYSEGDFFPIVWWGDIRVAADGALFAGIYPGLSIEPDNKVPTSGISFYRSTDNGKTWNIQGQIPYEPDVDLDSNGLKRNFMGFSEPGFTILKDGSFVCVMRASDHLGHAPMYISTSVDQGKTWTKPSAFTKAGVLPRLLQLKNGVIVLAAGRPGVQLRFCVDKNAEQWTDPFEILQNDVSCGYTEIIPSGPNSFLLIFSDFRFKNSRGEDRKAIKVQEVFVNPL